MTNDMSALRVSAEQARVALKELLNDTQHKDHDCGDKKWCPVLHAKRALASLEAALQSQPFPVEAQAVPDQPVAQVRVHKTGGNAGIAWSAQPLPGAPLMRDGELLFTRPTPAAADLHQQIVEAIAKQWDGCMTDMVGVGEIDIGATIRSDGVPHQFHAAAQLVAASPAAAAGVPTPETALERFNACEADKEPDPIERLRFFCSLAMSGQDWLDVEPFFDALASPVAPVGVPRDEQIEQVWFDNARDGRMLYGQFFAAARALLSAGVPLPASLKEVTEQQNSDSHSVHLAGGLIEQDFRRRPASSEAAPSADTSKGEPNGSVR